MMDLPWLHRYTPLLSGRRLQRVAVLGFLCCLQACTPLSALQPPPDTATADANWAEGKDTEGLVQTEADLLPWSDPLLRERQTRALAVAYDVRRTLLIKRRVDVQAEEAAIRIAPTASMRWGGSAPLTTDSDRSGSDSRAPGWMSSVSASAGISWEPDLWGRLAESSQLSAIGLKQAEVDVQAAQTLAWLRVTELHWTVGALSELHKLREQLVALSEDLLRLIRVRHREGKATVQELAQVEEQLLSARRQLAVLEGQRRTERRAMAQLLDLEAGDQLADVGRIPTGAPPDWRLPAPAVALNGRPDVQRARLEVDAALARLRQARGARYPSLSFSGELNTGGGTWRQWLGQPVGSLSAALLVPLVDWSRLQKREVSARIDLDLAALALRESVHRTQLEAEDIRQQRDLGLRALQISEAALRRAVEAERITEKRLHAGATSSIDLLRARQTRLQAEVDLMEQRLSSWINHAALFKILGLLPSTKSCASQAPAC